MGSDKLMRKIARLRALAERESTQPGEADAALAAINRLIDQHGLTADDLRTLPDDAWASDVVHPGRVTRDHATFGALYQLGKFCGIHITVTRGQINLFGASPDVDLAKRLLGIISEAAKAGLADYAAERAQGHPMRAGRSHLSASERTPWLKAFSLRIAQRLSDLISERRAGANSTALATLKGEVARDAWLERNAGVKLARSKVRNAYLDPAAWSHARGVADGVDLGGRSGQSAIGEAAR